MKIIIHAIQRCCTAHTRQLERPRRVRLRTLAGQDENNNAKLVDDGWIDMAAGETAEPSISIRASDSVCGSLGSLGRPAILRH